MIKCANDGCTVEFSRSAHNQKYCSPECLRIATNKRFREKYHEAKASMQSGPKICECGSRLSKYNRGDLCALCETKSRSKMVKELRGFLRSLGEN